MTDFANIGRDAMRKAEKAERGVIRMGRAFDELYDAATDVLEWCDDPAQMDDHKKAALDALRKAVALAKELRR